MIRLDVVLNIPFTLLNFSLSPVSKTTRRAFINPNLTVTFLPGVISKPKTNQYYSTNQSLVILGENFQAGIPE